jgi:hypothetical protein
MNRIEDLDSKNSEILEKVKILIARIEEAIGVEPIDNLAKGIRVLEKLRNTSYEDLNQIPHEAMIIRAAQQISATDYPGENVEWDWHPRQTGSKPKGSPKEKEPDLRGKIAGQIVVSAEITTSAKPIEGTMTLTLKKLNEMQVPGKKIYFVRTEEMEKRAKTKVSKRRYQIEVRRV